MAVKLTTKSGRTVLVDEQRVAAWEARGYERADKPEPAKKAPAKKASAKKSSK
jgi:hypothetical protein